MRQCSKPGCSRPSVATLTYNYKDSTAVLGPLSTSAEPHAFDLCEIHAGSLTVPRGWEVIRLQTEFDPAPPSADDLSALVDVIRQVAGRPERDEAEEAAQWAEERPQQSDRAAKWAPLRRGHLTVVDGLGPRPEHPRSAGPAKGVFGPAE